MDCPQCGAEIPSDDSFCGKCGYATREGAPERVDQSRIRVHEEPDTQAPDATTRSASQQRVRKHTVMGMPLATPPTGSRTPTSPAEVSSPSPPPPPTEISTARSRARARTPQKTMMGIPRPDFPGPPTGPAADVPMEADASAQVATERFGPPRDASPSHRARARVRYDSMNEPFPMFDRRKKALRGLALLVILAGAWLVYRFFTANG